MSIQVPFIRLFCLAYPGKSARLSNIISSIDSSSSLFSLILTNSSSLFSIFIIVIFLESIYFTKNLLLFKVGFSDSISIIHYLIFYIEIFYHL
jgi:hypothetical protein